MKKKKELQNNKIKCILIKWRKTIHGYFFKVHVILVFERGSSVYFTVVISYLRSHSSNIPVKKLNFIKVADLQHAVSLKSELLERSFKEFFFSQVQSSFFVEHLPQISEIYRNYLKKKTVKNIALFFYQNFTKTEQLWCVGDWYHLYNLKMWKTPWMSVNSFILQLY